MNSLNDILSQKSDDLFGTDDLTQTNTNTEDTENNTEGTEFKEGAETEDEVEEKNDQQSTILSESENEISPKNLEPKTSNSELKKMVHKMKDQLDMMLRMLNGDEVKINKQLDPDAETLEGGEKIIEGVFNGEQMIGPDGKEYSVPPNYASKSKMVEGDMLKLTITNNGSFIYKQIAPIERKRLTGELVSDPTTGQFSVLAEGRTYKILTASVTFFKGKPGDEVVILVPKDSESNWGAVENIISQNI